MSEITSQFLINPQPEIAVGSDGGSIAFNYRDKRFLIKLFTEDPHRSGAFTKSDLSNRLRFNYAHEVAHRFFFVPEDDVWVRAIHKVVKSEDGSDRIRALRALTDVEEGICNNIARRVLIPDDILLNTISPSLISDLDANHQGFIQTLDRTSKELLVSKECLLVRLRHGVASGIIKTPPCFALFVVQNSGSKKTIPTSGTIKIRVPMLPRTVFDIRVKPAFPGMELKVFGRSADQIVRQLIYDYKQTGAVKLPLRLPRPKDEMSSQPALVNLRGWWYKLPQAAKSTESRMIVWGSLEAAKE